MSLEDFAKIASVIPAAVFLGLRPEKTWTYNNYSKRYEGLTRETLKAFKDAEKVWLQDQYAIRRASQDAAQAVIKAVIDTGLFHRKVGRSSLYDTIMKFYNRPNMAGEMYTTPEENWLKDTEKAEHDTTAQKAQLAYRDKAILWLIGKGKPYGIAFTAENAVALAEHIAYEEEVSRAQGPGNASVWYDFEGKNCDEPCRGWNGVSHRCACGNRRVSWTQGMGHTFESPSVYAEAY